MQSWFIEARIGHWGIFQSLGKKKEYKAKKIKIKWISVGSLVGNNNLSGNKTAKPKIDSLEFCNWRAEIVLSIAQWIGVRFW